MTGESAIKISGKQNRGDICTLWEGENRCPLPGRAQAGELLAPFSTVATGGVGGRRGGMEKASFLLAGAGLSWGEEGWWAWTKRGDQVGREPS